MTEHAQTELAHDHPTSDASERAESISAGAALGKPSGPVTSDKPAKDLRRQSSDSALHQNAADLIELAGDYRSDDGPRVLGQRNSCSNPA